MSIEKCTHPYYRMENEKLLCTQCGAPSKRYKIEDKEQKPEEKKRGVIWPQQKKRRK